MEKTERRRLTFWAVVFIFLGIITAITLPADKLAEVLSLFKDVITHLIIG